MADKVKHWPDGMNWYARDEDGVMIFSSAEPKIYQNYYGVSARTRFEKIDNPELVEIDPSTPWTESKQRRPD